MISSTFKRVFIYLLLPLLIAALILLTLIQRELLSEETMRLHRAIRLMETVLRDAEPSDLEHLVKEIGGDLGIRYTLIDAGGRVIADTDRPPEAMDNHALRPEVMTASKEGWGDSIRYSYTLHRKMLYAAHRDGGRIIRAARPAGRFTSRAGVVLTGVMVLLLLGTLLTFLAARVIDALQERSRRVLLAPLIEKSGKEGSGNGAALVAEAASRIETLETRVRRAEALHALLAGGVEEGILLLDDDGRIVEMNDCAIRLISAVAAPVEGRLIREVVRLAEPVEMIERCLTTRKPRSGEFLLAGKKRRSCRIFLSPLEEGGLLGIVRENTRLRLAQEAREAFMANLSHQFRTPLATLRTALETLREERGGEGEEIITMMERHTERLHRMVENLLFLARVEREEEQGKIEKEETSVISIVEEATALLEGKIKEKRMKVVTDLPPGLTWPLNGSLICEALVNIVENALLYAPPGTTIRITGEVGEEGLLLAVEDEGPGIPEKERERIFERFVRLGRQGESVDGAGLGLAIVKHIARLHGGRVRAEGRPDTLPGMRVSLLL